MEFATDDLQIIWAFTFIHENIKTVEHFLTNGEKKSLLAISLFAAMFFQCRLLQIC